MTENLTVAAVEVCGPPRRSPLEGTPSGFGAGFGLGVVLAAAAHAYGVASVAILIALFASMAGWAHRHASPNGPVG